MTYIELRKHFNDTFGLDDWPKTFEIDSDTYSDVVNHYLNTFELHYEDRRGSRPVFIELSVGPHNGIMFKGVELILKR